MNLIVGLGNPGVKYATTRHNIGFMVIDHVLKNLVSVDKTWELRKDINAFVFKNGDLIFAKPQTFMNASGIAVAKLMNLYQVPPSQVWVIHDDVDLPLGKIRIRIAGSSAGHRGLESIMQEAGSQSFVRFRFGVGRGKLEEKGDSKHQLRRHTVEKYVVSKFSMNEEGDLRKMIKHGAEAVEMALHKGLDVAMNQYN